MIVIADDVQADSIKGKPYKLNMKTPFDTTTIVRWGANKFLDTVPLGDDKFAKDPISGDSVIVAGVNKICETTANSTNIIPNSIYIPSVSSLQTLIDNVYNKSAIIKFTVTSISVGSIPINYDLNRDGNFRIFDGNMAYKGDDADKVIGKYPSSIRTLFVVQSGNNGIEKYNISTKNLHYAGGNMQFNQNYGFIWFKNQKNAYPHELGHGTFGLQHPFNQFSSCHSQGKDPLNVMDYNTLNGLEIIRKYHSDIIHP
jgi:hypothetical protein